MKRIGIHTITDYVNYGNRLQNYAVQEVLRSLGFEVESIINYPEKPVESGWQFFLSRVRNAFSLTPMMLIRRGLQKINNRRNHALYTLCTQSKATAFREFSAQYITESDFILSPDTPQLDARYDFCVVGSDQIWNPTIRYGYPPDFLSYVSPEKRIALAPSIGVSEIPEQLQATYRHYLIEMAYLSVREEKGAELIRALCGREAEVLVDPTLVLSSGHWSELAKRAAGRPEEQYLLTYFIGDVSRSRIAALKKMAQREGLVLVMLNSLLQPERYDADPAAFLDYIQYASLVCTDSFHCIIFSMHFRRPFVVYNREGKSAPMSSRIDTLLRTFGFAGRREHELKESGKYFDIDFSQVQEVMALEREKVFTYLQKALSITNNES